MSEINLYVAPISIVMLIKICSWIEIRNLVIILVTFQSNVKTCIH